MPHLNKLRASYEKKGLRIIAITSEEPGVVGGFVKANNISYPVGISKDASRAYGGGGIPHAYLISPEGKVVWDGHPASLQNSQIEKLLRKTTAFYIRDVVPEVKPAATAFSKGKLGEAESLAKAVRAQEGIGREAITDADHVLARVESTRAFFQQRIKSGVENGYYDDVFDALDKIQKYFAGSEDATKAAAQEKQLKADPAVKRERKAAKALDKLYAEKEKAGYRAKKLNEVSKRVEKFIKKYGDTKAAKHAEALLDNIQKTLAKAR